MKPNTNLPPEAFAEQIARKRRNLNTANGLIGGIGCFPLMLFSISVIGITLKLGLLTLVFSLLLVPLCFTLHLKTGKLKPLLQVLRGICIALMAASAAAVICCLNFQRTPLMYHAKCWVFTHGVRETGMARNGILPEHLPDNISDYYFRTEPCMPAQDYTPCAYLFLHTDRQTLEQYAAKLDAYQGISRIETAPPEDYEPAPDELYKPADFPGFVFSQFTSAGFTDDLSHAVVYFPSARAGQWFIGSGALINYETGLFAVWI